MDEQPPAPMSYFDRRAPLLTGFRVVLIMGVLFCIAGVVFPLLPHSHPPGRPIKTANMVRDMHIAILNFKANNGVYPWGAGPVRMSDVIRELAPGNPRITLGRPPVHNMQLIDYLYVPDDLLQTFRGGTTLCDSWGRIFGIRYDVKTDTVIVCSRGADGVDETFDGDDDYGDDILAP